MSSDAEAMHSSTKGLKWRSITAPPWSEKRGVSCGRRPGFDSGQTMNGPPPPRHGSAKYCGGNARRSEVCKHHKKIGNTINFWPSLARHGSSYGGRGISTLLFASQRLESGADAVLWMFSYFSSMRGSRLQ